MAAKKGPIKAVKAAAKKVRGMGALMSKSEMADLLSDKPRTKKAATKKKSK